MSTKECKHNGYKGLRVYTPGMKLFTPEEVEKIRSHFQYFLERKGRGTLQACAFRIGVSRGYLGRFRDGENIGANYIYAVAQYMELHGYPVPGIVVDPPHESLRDSEPFGPIEMLASELRLLADDLVSPALSKERKRQRYLEFIKGHAVGLDEDAASILEEGG